MSHQHHSTRSQQRLLTTAHPANEAMFPNAAPAAQGGVLKLSANAPSFFPASFPLNQSHQKSEVSSMPSAPIVNQPHQSQTYYHQTHIPTQPNIAPQRPFYFNQSIPFSNTSSFQTSHDFPISAEHAVRNIHPSIPQQSPFPYQTYAYPNQPQPVYFASPHYFPQNQRIASEQHPAEAQYSYANNQYLVGMNGAVNPQPATYYSQPPLEKVWLAGH